MAPLPELRRRIGAQLSDEEFLLRATMPANLVDAMQAAGPAPRDYDPALRPVLELIRALCARRDLADDHGGEAGFRLELQEAVQLKRVADQGVHVRSRRHAGAGGSHGKSYDVLPGAIEVLTRCSERGIP